MAYSSKDRSDCGTWSMWSKCGNLQGVDLLVHWIPGAVFCANRKLHTLSALEEELAKRRTCPAVGGSDESCHIHLQPTVVLDKQAALPWHECSH